MTEPFGSDDEDWVPLPGLFDESELAMDAQMEVRATPLVIARGRTFYAVSVRTRPPADTGVHARELVESVNQRRPKVA